jgi:hypothetical protein
MRIGTELNEYGTPVGVFQCQTCRERFTVCPDPVRDKNWKNCLSKKCDSYDPMRDANIIFDDPDLWERLHDSEVDVRKKSTGKYN